MFWNLQYLFSAVYVWIKIVIRSQEFSIEKLMAENVTF
jgi:hypothetical protein